MTYIEFLEAKRQSDNQYGFTPSALPDFLFDFQKALVDWALRKGRGALFTDCGTGKTPMSLVWADQTIRRTNKPVLILTPLAVSYQTIHEGAKFGIEVLRSQDGKHIKGITVTNYARLEHFSPHDFGGVVCDESACLKSFDSVRRSMITDFMKKIPYRLLCTATAAPNDWVELGTSSEALGHLGYMDMLNRFFKNDNNTSDTKGRYRGFHAPRAFEGQKWRFKGHAEVQFWRWVCSWSRAMRRPSDLGFDDGPFILPPLVEREHYIESRTLPPGALFHRPAEGLHEQREERRRTLVERCEAAAKLMADCDRSLMWCNLNDEGDLLERLIPDAVQIKGSDTDERKEEVFMSFANGQISHLVSKCSIAGWGLNFQNCSRIGLFPSHSFEQYYQGIRRCWRFGQKQSVIVDIIATEGDRAVMDNLRRKAKAADQMFTSLVAEMRNALDIGRSDYRAGTTPVPGWL